ncbi:MAG: OmpA family protein [Methyloprofundus sp.]|nr:OmpA family protein [Methyloprofundus sp.]
MLKKLIVPALSMTGIALSGCATQQPTSYPSFTPAPVGQTTTTTRFTQKVDTVFVIVDASNSKNDTHDTHGVSKFDVEKQFLNRFNKTLPSNIRLATGIRNFGMGSCLGWSTTQLVKDIAPHSTSQFQAGLDAMECASGGSPMGNALAAAQTDLDKATGTTALLIIGDGHRLSQDTLVEAQALQDKFGNKLCIYSVWVGNEEEQDGQFFLQEMSNIAGCGLSESVTDLRSPAAVAGFVEGMLFTSTAIAYRAPVVTASDSDGDGVDDVNDKCPKTPAGAKVNSQGCWSFNEVEFGFNTSTIKPEYANLFDNAIQILKLNPSMTIQVEGHTDSQGPAEYNLALSAKRAQAVKDLLVENGISADRLSVKGFGESLPLATNDTPEGRAENRRVTYTVTHW